MAENYSFVFRLALAVTILQNTKELRLFFKLVAS